MNFTHPGKQTWVGARSSCLSGIFRVPFVGPDNQSPDNLSCSRSWSRNGANISEDCPTFWSRVLAGLLLRSLPASQAPFPINFLLRALKALQKHYCVTCLPSREKFCLFGLLTVPTEAGTRHPHQWVAAFQPSQEHPSRKQESTKLLIRSLRS